jgi:hypothetical protein
MTGYRAQEPNRHSNVSGSGRPSRCPQGAIVTRRLTPLRGSQTPTVGGCPPGVIRCGNEGKAEPAPALPSASICDGARSRAEVPL